MAKSSFFSGTGTNSTDVDSITSSKAAAEAAATNAATSETNAASSASSASTSASNASTSASNASNSATAAATSETNAASSATAASASQTSATNSASAAATSATNAATSEANAATSETNAASSATAAATSATSAATSLSNIGAAETNAANSATAAATSATNASTSATNAATSETNAATSASTASTAATNAATSETNASTSATNAATSATNAATSETNAATSATSASTSASAASTSATAAAASQSAAAASAASAASAYDTFDDRYLGSKTADPTVDNDGDALVAGALYFNSTANEMRVYDGANWIAATSAGNASLLEYKYTATSGQTTFSGADDSSNTLSYTQNNLIVTLNGVVLENGTDYTATTGTSVVLASGAATSDELNVIAFKSFTTADMVSSANGGTFYNDVSLQGDLSFGDNDKAIFGAGSDLQIYHDGSNSYVSDQGTGNLNVRGTNLVLGNASGSNSYLAANDGGGVYLYYAGQNKIETTSTGIDVNGTVTADGLTVDGTLYANRTDAAAILTLQRSGSSVFQLSSDASFGSYLDNPNGDTYIRSTGVKSILLGTNGVSQRQKIENNGDISFYEDTGTTPKFFWDASAESLGIGTSSPSRQLHLSGSTPIIRLTDTDTNAYGEISSSSSDGNLMFYADQGNTQANTTIRFYVDTTERMRIDSNGYVGIGTSSPHLYYASQLVVDAPDESGITIVGDTTHQNYIMFADGTSGDTRYRGYIAYDHADDHLKFATLGAERMRIDSSGNVMIGTTTAGVSGGGEQLTVDNASGNAGISIRSNGTGNGNIYFSDNTTGTGQYAGNLRYDHNTNAMMFNTNSSERMRIDSSGHVLVGTTTKETRGVTLYGTGANGIYAKCTGTTNYWITRDGQGAGSGYIATIYSDTTPVGSITVTASSTAYNTSSDYRLKENVTDVTDGITRVKQLAPKRFNFIADPDTTVDGFIAHEVQDVIPEAISGAKDAMRDEEYEVTPEVLDDDGNVVTEAVMGTRSVPDYQGIDQSKLVPLLTAALQEAIAKIETLETEMTSVKARLDALEAN